jgi:hypothetical protein
MNSTIRSVGDFCGICVLIGLVAISLVTAAVLIWVSLV